MTSPFAAALAAADVVLDEQMGEAVQITPMRGGDFGRQTDAGRAVIDVVALVGHVDPSSADIATLESRVGYEEVEVEIRRAALPADVVFRKGDDVLLLDRPGAPRYKISRIDGNDPSRWVLSLAGRGAA